MIKHTTNPLHKDFTKNEILELSQEFKRRRQYLNLTQTKLAKLANLSQSIITKLERATIDPTYSTILKIDRALQEQEQISNLTAKKIMIPYKDIFYLKPQTKLHEVIDIIRTHDFSQFTVIENNTLLGTIYEKTIFDAIANKADIYEETIEKYIEPNPIIVPPQYPTSDLSYIFQNRKTKFVLVGKNNKILGLITNSDLFKKYK